MPEVILHEVMPEDYFMPEVISLVVVVDVNNLKNGRKTVK